MILFNSLSDYMNYVPNCVICGKPMNLFVEGYLTSATKKKPRYNRGRDHLYARLKLEDGYLLSVHKQLVFSIDPHSNEVTIGADVINRLQEDKILAHKSCTTCHFKISAAFHKPQKHSNYYQYSDKLGQAWKENYFPPFSLKEEELHYTLKGGVDVRIQKNYSWPSSENTTATISLNYKNLPPMPLDFDKFEGLDHLNKRIATIKLFH